MTAILGPWPDIEAVLVTLLAPVAQVVTTTPANLTPPLVQVQRFGGADDGLTDFPVVAVTCFGGTRAAAWSMAENCRQRILASPGEPGVLIDSAETVTPSQQVPDPNTSLRVVTATYRLGLRRPRNLS